MPRSVIRWGLSGALGKLILPVLLLIGVSAAPVRAAEPAADAPLPVDLLRELGRLGDESLAGGRANYLTWSAPVVAYLTRLWGGEWWVIGFREAGRADWIRGVLGGEYTLGDEDEAIARAELVKEGLRDLFYCCRTSFGAPLVREDAWTWLVEYPQVVRNIPVERALLRLRLLKDYRASDRERGSQAAPTSASQIRIESRGQWNIEIMDLAVDLPAGIDPRPFVTPEGAREAFRLALVPAEALAGEPQLLFCRDRDAEEPPRLCWQVEDGENRYRLDALTGELFGVMDKSRPLW